MALASTPASALQLLGQDIRTVTCAEFRKTILGRGAVLLHEPDRLHISTVDPDLLLHGGGEGELGITPGRQGARFRASKLLAGADQLELRCLSNGQVASVRYRLPSIMDAGHVERVKEMVASKYGPPDRRQDDDGAVFYTWRQNGVNVHVFKWFPQSTVHIYYVVQGRGQLYREETKRLMQDEARRKATQQKDAF